MVAIIINFIEINCKNILISETLVPFFQNLFPDHFNSVYGLFTLTLHKRIQQGGVVCVPLFCNHLFLFYNNFEELQTVLYEVELIINNAPLTYVYPNTIGTCLTPNYLIFGR